MKPTTNEIRNVAVDTHEVLRLIFRAAQQMNAGSRALFDVLLADQRFVGVKRGNNRRKNSDQDQEAQDNHTNNPRSLSKEPSYGYEPQIFGFR